MRFFSWTALTTVALLSPFAIGSYWHITHAVPVAEGTRRPLPFTEAKLVLKDGVVVRLFDRKKHSIRYTNVVSEAIARKFIEGDNKPYGIVEHTILRPTDSEYTYASYLPAEELVEIIEHPFPPPRRPIDRITMYEFWPSHSVPLTTTVVTEAKAQ